MAGRNSVAVRGAARLAYLRLTGLMDSPTEMVFDRLTRLAAKYMKAPVALISLVEADRQFFKSSVGLAEPWASARQTPLTHSFCQHVVASGRPLVIDDAREHPLVCENLAIQDLRVIAYLGMPLITEEGHVLGSLCTIDSVPREWADDDLETMRDLAALVMREITSRVDCGLLERRYQELFASEGRFRATLDRLPFGVLTVSSDGCMVLVNRAWEGLWSVPQAWNEGASLLSDQDLEALGVTDALRAALAGEVASFGPVLSELTIPGPPGQERRIAWTIYPISDEGGAVREAVMIIRGIDEPEGTGERAGDRWFPSTESEGNAREPDVNLSTREREVLILLSRGHTNRQVGEMLSISEKTVETYRARLASKLGLRTRAEIIRFAAERRLRLPERSG